MRCCCSKGISKILIIIISRDITGGDWREIYAQVDRSDGTFTATGDESDVDILYISPYQVVCSLPRSQSYKVTLEHSGEPLSVTHSSPQPYASNFIFMAYDSACYICDINTQSCDEREVCWFINIIALYILAVQSSD